MTKHIRERLAKLEGKVAGPDREPTIRFPGDAKPIDAVGRPVIRIRFVRAGSTDSTRTSTNADTSKFRYSREY